MKTTNPAYIFGDKVGDLCLLATAYKSIILSSDLSLGSDKYLGLLEATADGEAIWYDAAAYDHNLRPQTNGRGRIGAPGYAFKEGHFVQIGDVTYPATNIYGTYFHSAGVAGLSALIPNTFNNLYVNGGLITHWD